MEQTLLGPSQLFDRAWMIFEKKWKSALLIFLPLIGFVIAWMILMVVMVGGTAMLGGMSDFSGLGAGIIIAIVVSYIVFLVVGMWVQLAEIYLVVHHDRDVSFNEAYSASKQYILPYLWVSLLLGLIVATGFMVLIIPGIILAVAFAFSHLVLVDQNIKGLNAALTSREYVRGRWWGVFGRFFVLGLVYFILIILISALQEQLAKAGYPMFAGIVALVSWVVQMAMNFLAVTYGFALYENLKALKPGVIPIADGTRKKFTVMAVVGIVAMIALFALPIMLLAINPSGLVKTARDANRMADLAKIQGSLDLYKATNGTYPTSLDALVQAGGIGTLPVDPKTKAPYQYTVTEDGNDFSLCARLEEKSGNSTGIMAKPDILGSLYCVSSSESGDANSDRMRPNEDGTFPAGDDTSGGSDAGMTRPAGEDPGTVDDEDLSAY